MDGPLRGAAELVYMKDVMTPLLSKLLILSLLFGAVEAGFDVPSIVTPGDQGAAHEVHRHLGSGSEPPDEGDDGADHYCHCSTHAPVLSSFSELASLANAKVTYPAVAQSYHSLGFPPAVRPPKI